MNSLPVAIQVYSVRDLAEKDFIGTMKQIKEMGYQGVELAGLYGQKPELVKQILEEIGLTIVSAHVPYEELIGDLDKTLHQYEILNCPYIVIPYLSIEKRYGTEEYASVLTNIKKFADACKKRGISLSYHNHDFEFEKTEKGTYVLDELLGSFEPDELYFEPDTCWIKVAGEDPKSYLERYHGRCPLVHLKDFQRNNRGEIELVSFGDGVQQAKELIQKAAESGAKWLIVEQDDHPYNSAMENMKRSVEFIQKN